MTRKYKWWSEAYIYISVDRRLPVPYELTNVKKQVNGTHMFTIRHSDTNDLIGEFVIPLQQPVTSNDNEWFDSLADTIKRACDEKLL